MSDDLDRYLNERMQSPAFKRAYEQAERDFASAEAFACPNGCCEEHLYRAHDGSVGTGPVSCPHREDDTETIRATWTKVTTDE